MRACLATTQSMWQHFIWSEQELLLEKRHAVLWLVLGVAHRLVRLLLLLLLLLVVVRVIRVRRAHRVAEPGQGEAASLRGRHRRALAAGPDAEPIGPDEAALVCGSIRRPD